MIFSNMKDESKKATPTIHSDIEGWLKSVDALSKDLKELLDVKKRVAAKMDSIKKKYKPEKQKSQEEEPQEEKDKSNDAKRIKSKKPKNDQLAGDVAKAKSKAPKSVKSGAANIGDESQVEPSDSKKSV